MFLRTDMFVLPFGEGPNSRIIMDLLYIAQTLKKARLQQKLTIDALAQKTSLSKGLISRLENFRITPSLKVLGKLTIALGLEMVDLFQPDVNFPVYLFGNLNEGEEIIRNHSDRYGITYSSLAYKKRDRKLDPFIVEYHPSTVKRSFLSHEMEEFFVLLEGKVDFFVMDESHGKTLTADDTVYLSKGIPHAVQLTSGEKQARALVIYREESGG